MDNYNRKKQGAQIIPNICLFGLTVILILGCNGSTNKEAKADQEAFSQLEQSGISIDIKNEEIETIIRGLPAPSEVPLLLRKTGAGFDPNLLNPLDRTDSYRSTNFKASLNLGVYAADIGYLCSYGKSQEALNYLENSKLLADHMGVTTAFDVNFVRQFEDSIGNPDYLLKLIDQSIAKVSGYLRTEDRTDLSILVLSGGFIEGFYLTTNLLLLYSPDRGTDDSIRKIYARIYDLTFTQKDHLYSLLDLLKSLEADTAIESFIIQLEDLNELLERGYSDDAERRLWVQELNKNIFKIRAEITS